MCVCVGVCVRPSPVRGTRTDPRCLPPGEERRWSQRVAQEAPVIVSRLREVEGVRLRGVVKSRWECVGERTNIQGKALKGQFTQNRGKKAFD